MAAPFQILNSRKRALIALIHSVFFLGLATRDWAASARLNGAIGHARPSIGSLVLVGIYLVVSTVLLALLYYSGGLLERLYFAFCAASATSGLVRALVGDASFSAGQYLRVGMLLCAVLTGFVVLRMHSVMDTTTGATPLLEEG